MKHKHGILFFISSCIPGCGQMHLGFMKRGISILTACSALCVIAIALYMEELILLLVPVWLASFFDSYNLRQRLEEDATPADTFLFGLSDLDAEKFSRLFSRRHSLVGWGLVVTGIYMLYDTVMPRLINRLCEYLDDWFLYDVLVRDLPRLGITIGIILLGIWFIRGPKKAKAEDIPVFVPPVTEEEAHGNSN